MKQDEALYAEAIKFLEEAAAKYESSFTINYKFKKEKWFIRFGHLKADNVDFLQCSVDILTKIWNIDPAELSRQQAEIDRLNSQENK